MILSCKELGLKNDRVKIVIQEKKKKKKEDSLFRISLNVIGFTTDYTVNE